MRTGWSDVVFIFGELLVLLEWKRAESGCSGENGGCVAEEFLASCHRE